MTRSLFVFPHHRTADCLRAFVTGYGAERPYNVTSFWRHIVVRLARYYLETGNRAGYTVRIGGIPVRRSKLRVLMLAALRGDYEEVSPDLATGTLVQ